jgi:hypothetical protein
MQLKLQISQIITKSKEIRCKNRSLLLPELKCGKMELQENNGVFYQQSIYIKDE